jgi:hypothetical protein
MSTQSIATLLTVASFPSKHASMRVLACLVVALGSGCSDDPGASLLVDLRTDFAPQTDFQRVRTTLSASGGAPALLVEHNVTDGESYLMGVRVADYAEVAPGSVTLLVQLVKTSGSVVAEQSAAVEIRADLAVTVVVTRSCLGVECPGAGDDPMAIACLGGRCVVPECSPEHPELCGPSECTAPADCTGFSECAEASCELGSCLAVADDTRCEVGEFCDRMLGCLSALEPDAGALDAGVGEPDAGRLDAGGPSPLDCADHYLGSAVGASVARGTTRGAGDDSSRCLGESAADLSFGWVAPNSGSYRIETCRSRFDTVLTVLEGSCDGPQRACADDGCGVSSRLTLSDVAAGDAFVIIVDGLREEGEFELSIVEL